MTTYILDIKTKEYSIVYDMYMQGPVVEYYFKIDNNGNVDISKFEKYRGRPIRQDGGIEQVLKINDNIPIPNYFIDIINFLINPITINDIIVYERDKDRWDFAPNQPINSANNVLTDRYWEIVVTTIKRIKENVKKIVENPQDNLDIKLDSYISKTKLQQENIVELEKKQENIQLAYFDTLNDNKKLKDRIKQKDDKQVELECENKRLLQELNAMKQLEETKKQEQQKMEELETEEIKKWSKLKKQNYNPLYH
jgi:hypothetical protein